MTRVFVISVLAFVSNFAYAQTSIMKVIKTTPVAPAFCGNPVKFATVSRDNKQIIAFYDGNRELTLAIRNYDSADWKFHKLGEIVEYDAHNSIVMTLDSEGFIHITANMHVVPLNYWRSSRPMDITSMERLDRMVGSNETRCTYPNFFTGPGKKLMFKYRDGHSGDGREIVNVYDVKTKTWTRFLQKPLLDGNSPMGTTNAYQTGPVLGKDGYYHLAWVWRSHFGCESNHMLQYASSKDLVNWETSSGKAIELPIKVETAETVAPLGEMAGLLNAAQLSFDKQGRVMLCHYAFDQDGDTQVYHVRLEKDGWKSYQTTDWIGRWDFHGGGSIPSNIRVKGLKTLDNDYFLMRFSNKTRNGDLREYAYIVDSNTLRPIGEEVRFFPEEYEQIKSKVAGMQVSAIEDWSQAAKTGKVYVLRWETLDAARDSVKNLDWIPRDQLLEVVEMEVCQLPAAGPITKTKNRTASYKNFFAKIDFAGQSGLQHVQEQAQAGSYEKAVSALRAYYLKRENPAFALSPKSHPAFALPLKQDPAGEKVLKNEFEYFGLTRTLFFNNEVWEPINPQVLAHWTVLRPNHLESRPVEFHELEKASLISKWYNRHNELGHVKILAQAYFDTQNQIYARKFAHDLGDWCYDNPVPAQIASCGPWYVSVASARLSNMVESVPLVLDSNAVNDVELFRLLNAIQVHYGYLKNCIVAATVAQEDVALAKAAIDNVKSTLPELITD